jgi:hypothetical protein
MRDDAARPEATALGAIATDLTLLALGFVASLIGDACHVASGMTRYTWQGLPSVGYSAFWFPLVSSVSILTVARAGNRLRLPRRPRSRIEAAAGVAAVLSLYALTAALHGQPAVVAVTLCSGLSVVVWALWDPSFATFAVASLCACIGPLAEIGFVKLGAVEYGVGSQGLAGVSPTLPSLYFAAAAVTSGLHRTLKQLTSS